MKTLYDLDFNYYAEHYQYFFKDIETMELNTEDIDFERLFDADEPMSIEPVFDSEFHRPCSTCSNLKGCASGFLDDSSCAVRYSNETEQFYWSGYNEADVS